jgi:hypothetical protein
VPGRLKELHDRVEVGLLNEALNRSHSREMLPGLAEGGKWRPDVKVETPLTASAVHVAPVLAPSNTLLDSERSRRVRLPAWGALDRRDVVALE